MTNGSFRSRLHAIYHPAAATQRRRDRRPLIDDDDDDVVVDQGMQSMHGLNGFSPSWIPRGGVFVHTDAHGNTHELTHGVGGRIHHYIRTDNSLVTRDMGEGPTSAPRSDVGNNGGHAPGNFNSAFSELDDPFDGAGAGAGSGSGSGSPRGRRVRRGHVGAEDDFPEVELPYGAVFSATDFMAAIEALRVSPDTTGASRITAEAAAEFISHFTQPVAHGDDHGSPNTECPICLEPPTLTHDCVRITNIPGCNHLIGRECLKGLLLTHGTQSKKVCPLCRTEWMVGEEQQTSGVLGDSPLEHQGQGEFEGSPRGRRPGRRPHDNHRRGDRRPAGHARVYSPEEYSPSEEDN